MALIFSTTYSGRSNAPTTAYPYGSHKNRSTSTSQDGSYYEQAWANDILGFHSQLLSAAGITPSGNPDQVGASDYYTALTTIFSQINSPVFTGSPKAPTPVTTDNSTNIATTAFTKSAISTAITAATGRLKNIIAITASGTYTPSTGTTFIVVEGVGGGGGGGGAASASATASVGGGGGAGGYFLGVISSLASSYSVTIGAAGTAGTPSAVGGTGGTTTFGSFTAPGGSGGQSYASAQSAASGAAQGGATGTGSGGTVGISQSYGSPGWWATYGLGLSGRGGLSRFGDGGQEVIISASSAQTGVTATGYGAGGGGAYSSGAGYSANGGAGKTGLILVYEYY